MDADQGPTGSKSILARSFASTGLADALGVRWRPARFIVNRQPWLAGVIVALASTGAAQIFNPMFTNGEWLPLSYQWFASLADAPAFGILVGFVLWALQRAVALGLSVRLSATLHRRLLFGAFSLSVAMKVPEVLGIGLLREFGPGSLWHLLVTVPLLAYMTSMLLCAFGASRALYSRQMLRLAKVVLVIAIVCLLAYTCAFVWDVTHQLAPDGRIKNFYSSPPLIKAWYGEGSWFRTMWESLFS